MRMAPFWEDDSRGSKQNRPLCDEFRKEGGIKSLMVGDNGLEPSTSTMSTGPDPFSRCQNRPRFN